MIWVRRSSPKALLHFLQLLDDGFAHQLLGTQHFQVPGDAALDLGQLVEDLLALHAGQALQLQLDDGLRLFFGELRTPRSAHRGPRGARGPRGSGGSLRPGFRERLLEAQQQVLAFAGLAQLVFGAPPDHFHAMLDEAA